MFLYLRAFGLQVGGLRMLEFWGLGFRVLEIWGSLKNTVEG